MDLNFIKFLLPNNHPYLMANQFCKIDTSQANRRLVIPDVHGCSRTLKDLLYKINLQKNDFLFFLGDFIDKGIDSKGVLDILLDLQQKGFQIYPLRGNHEEQLMHSIATEEVEDLLIYHQNQNLEPLLNSEGLISKIYADFLWKLPYYYELEDYYLVHAGFDFSAENPFEEFKEMLWIRDFEIDKNKIGNKRIIHGHTPTPLEDIKNALESQNQVIALDSGAVFYDFKNKGYGSLICLDLDTFQLYEQENLEQKRL